MIDKRNINIMTIEEFMTKALVGRNVRIPYDISSCPRVVDNFVGAEYADGYVTGIVTKCTFIEISYEMDMKSITIGNSDFFITYDTEIEIIHPF